MDFPCKMYVFKGSRISMEFDIIRYVLIFLTYFGHNLGTGEYSCFAIDLPFGR
jgi:fucose 4-O-acetylase-like acetyltransferase